MLKYILSLMIVGVLAVSAQATGGGYYYSQPQRVVTIERVVTPHVTVRREFVEVPGLVYSTDYGYGGVVQEVVIERNRFNNNRQVVIQKVVVNNHNRNRVVERVVVVDRHGNQKVVQRVVNRHGHVVEQRVVKVQKVVVRQQQRHPQQQRRRGFFRR
jgi:hypothetical protein